MHTQLQGDHTVLPVHMNSPPFSASRVPSAPASLKHLHSVATRVHIPPPSQPYQFLSKSHVDSAMSAYMGYEAYSFMAYLRHLTTVIEITLVTP
jgi:hypothetical protein